MCSKQKIHSHFQKNVSERIVEIRTAISNLTQDAQNDAKGSAGDKHETTLAMMHLEQEKLSQKLKEILHQKTILDSINTTTPHQIVALGSLVETNSFTFFIAAALPKITFEGKEILSISPQSPLGSILLGKKVGDEVIFNTTKYFLLSIE